MNKRVSLLVIAITLGFFSGSSSLAQSTLDSLRTVVQQSVADSAANPTETRRVLSAYLYQARTNNSTEDVIYAYQQLAALNYNTGDINQALKFYKLYVIELEELTEFEEYREQQFEKNLYENEIRALNERVKELEEELASSNEARQSTYEQNYVIYLGLRIALGIALILGLGWLYNRYKKGKNESKVLPEPQSNKDELAELLTRTKSDLVSVETELALADILVQNNIAPVEEYFEANKSLRRKFLFSHPKDLASGAGLYLHSAKNNTIIVVFNSASSGAPGGLLVGQIYHQLDEIVKGLGITSPSLILEQLEQRLNDLFPAGIPFTGGLACGVCLYNNSDRIITYAGSGMDLFEIDHGTLTTHSGSSERLLEEESNNNWTNQNIDVSRGKNFYLATESYWLQQGGHDFKPLGLESFEKTLISIDKQSVEEQKLIISRVFTEWLGGNEQIGDILVFGFML